MDIAWPLALEPGGIDLHGTVSIQWEQPERLDVIEVHPVSVVGHAEARGDLMDARATLTTRVVYRCVRCLTPVAKDVTASLHERFSRTPVEPGVEEDEVIFTDSSVIVLDPYVEQELLFALEHHPVCREDCKGLCHICGADLNEGECGCDRKPLDPRLAALSQLLDEMQNSEDSE